MIELISIVSLVLLALPHKPVRLLALNLFLSASLWIYLGAMPESIIVLSLVVLSGLCLWRNKYSAIENLSLLSLMSLAPLNSVVALFVVAAVFKSHQKNFLWPLLLVLGQLTLLWDNSFTQLVFSGYALIAFVQSCGAFWQRRFQWGIIWSVLLVRFASYVPEDFISIGVAALSLVTLTLVIHSLAEARKLPRLHELQRYAGMAIIFSLLTTGLAGLWAMLSTWQIFSIILDQRESGKPLFRVPKIGVMILLLLPVAPAMIFMMGAPQSLIAGSLAVFCGLWLMWNYLNAADDVSTHLQVTMDSALATVAYVVIISFSLNNALAVSLQPLFVHLVISVIFVLVFMVFALDKKLRPPTYICDKVLFWGYRLRFVNCSSTEASKYRGLPLLSALRSVEGFLRYNAEVYLHRVSTGLAAWAILLVIICLFFGGIYEQ